ncbi:hypothetical protein GCM10028807_42470 [Spirosoma daeguense]
MLTDATTDTLFYVLAQSMSSFLGLYERDGFKPIYINPAGLQLLNVSSLNDYLEKYPHGFLRQPANPANAAFDQALAQSLIQEPWVERVDCELHTTKKSFWASFHLITTEVDGKSLLLLRITDVVFPSKEHSQNVTDTSAMLLPADPLRTDVLQHSLHELEVTKEALEQALGRERTLHQRKTAFITAMSHEFRNPMAILQTSAMLVLKLTNQPEKLTRHAQIIQRQVEHLKALLDTLVEHTLNQEQPPSAQEIHQTADILKHSKP